MRASGREGEKREAARDPSIVGLGPQCLERSPACGFPTDAAGFWGSAGRARGLGWMRPQGSVKSPAVWVTQKTGLPIENTREGTTDTEQLQEKGEGARAAPRTLRPKGSGKTGSSVENPREGCSPAQHPWKCRNRQQGWLRGRKCWRAGEGGGHHRPSAT